TRRRRCRLHREARMTIPGKSVERGALSVESPDPNAQRSTLNAPQRPTLNAPQRPQTLRRKDVLGLAGWSRDEIDAVLANAGSFKEVLARPIKKVPPLR